MLMKDTFGRTVDYLRISVTDKCNLRCTYCMPEEGIPLKSHREILRLEEIAAVARAAAGLGITKVRLTGGEPLFRRNIESLVRWIGEIPGITDLSMTTNAVMLDEAKAHRLKAAGLARVNISLDTLDPERYRMNTRCGNVEDTLAGIFAAKRAGLTPIKINMVIFKDTTERDIEVMSQFCRAEGLALQKIMQFSLYDREDLANHFHTERPPRCGNCNRIRLTADGYLKPCLFSDNEIKVDLDRIEESILHAVRVKPECGAACNNRTMSQIGG
jgi:cyclic pyranopterin phosphate synthase